LPNLGFRKAARRTAVYSEWPRKVLRLTETGRVDGMMTLVRKGNRLFTVTCLWLVLSAAGHSSTLFNELPEEFDTALDEMRLAAVEVTDWWDVSLFEVVTGVWVQVGVLLLGMALLNLVALAASGGDARMKRALTIANLIVFVPMTVLFIVIPIPPPLIAFGVASVLFATDLALSRGNTEKGK